MEDNASCAECKEKTTVTPDPGAGSLIGWTLQSVFA
jgi:hypothetical protein